MRYHDKQLNSTYDYEGFSGPVTYPYSSNYAQKRTGGWTRPDIVRVQRNALTGWRQPTPYDSIDDFIEREEGHITCTSLDTNPQHIGSLPFGDRYKGTCSWIPRFDPKESLSYLDSSTYDKLAIKNLLKLRDQKVNLALTIGEGHKSIDTIASVATKLTTSIRAFRRGNFKQALKIVGVTSKGRGKNAADAWLEMQYGVLPMMQDVQGIFEELTRDTRRHGNIYRIKSMQGNEDNSSGFYPDMGYSIPLPQSSFQQGFGVRCEQYLNQTAVLINWFELVNPELVKASAIGLTNPLEIIWEVIPWSFVVDWFIPVGNYLGALTADQGFSYLGGTYTVNTRLEQEYTAVAKQPWQSGDLIQTPSCAGSIKRTYYRSNRQLAEPPTASLPLPKNPLSVKHAVNAVALLRSTR